jgi:integrase
VNPCAHTELPRVITQPKRIITSDQFEAILGSIPARYRMLVLLAIETGMRWGELIALRPVDISFSTNTVTVRRTIVEVSKKNSPTGVRCFGKEYPKDREQRDIQIDKATCRQLREHMVAYGVRDEDLLFTSTAATPISRNNFRTKYWVVAVKAAAIKQKVTFHNLRAAHASWLLAGVRTSSSSRNGSGIGRSPPPSSTPGLCPTPASERSQRSERFVTPVTSSDRSGRPSRRARCE